MITIQRKFYSPKELIINKQKCKLHKDTFFNLPKIYYQMKIEVLIISFMTGCSGIKIVYSDLLNEVNNNT